MIVVFSYFVHENDDSPILWERWFHLTDVVKDLPPMIAEFNSSSEKASGKPGDGSFKTGAPYLPLGGDGGGDGGGESGDLPTPLNLDAYITEHIDAIK